MVVPLNMTPYGIQIFFVSSYIQDVTCVLMSTRWSFLWLTTSSQTSWNDIYSRSNISIYFGQYDHHSMSKMVPMAFKSFFLQISWVTSESILESLSEQKIRSKHLQISSPQPPNINPNIRHNIGYIDQLCHSWSCWTFQIFLESKTSETCLT